MGIIMDYIFGILSGLVCGLAAAILATRWERISRGTGVKQILAEKRQRIIFAVVVLGCCAIGAFAVRIHTYGENAIKLIVLASYLTSVTVNDIKRREIPDLTTIVFTVIFLAVLLWFDGPKGLVSGLIGTGLSAGLLLLVWLIKKEAVGLGDIKMIAACGLICGFPGMFYVLIRAAMAGLLYSLIMLLMKKLKLKSELPFAQFLLFGALI